LKPKHVSLGNINLVKLQQKSTVSRRTMILTSGIYLDTTSMQR